MAASVHTAFWLVIASLCGGCPRLGVCVTVPDKRASNLSIRLAEGDDCKDTAMITRLVVRRISDGTVFWTIGSTDGTSLTVVRYGEVPPGFDQGPPAAPLTPGDRVNIFVNGRGTSGGIDVTLTE
jgi:hypothetical protein